MPLYMDRPTGPVLDPTILAYYNRRPEETRLERGLCQLEGARVLRPGAVLFAAAISRWAPLLDGLAYDVLAAGDYREAMERALRDGQHRNRAQRDGLFTAASAPAPTG